jgi:hypothetical protein
VKRIVVFASLLLVGSPTLAGPYSDDLAKCLVASTSSDDRVALVRWMFTSFAAHPDVAPLSAATTAQVDAIDSQVGAIFTRLLTQSCREQTQAALRYEGTAAIETAFQVLGQVAANELGTNPAVQKRLAALGEKIDQRALEALVQAPAPKQP